MATNHNQIQWYPGHMARARREISEAVKLVDVVIDGPYVEELRDITLPMRGSSNQSIIELTKE